MPTILDMLSDYSAFEESVARCYRFYQSWCALAGWPKSRKFFRLESKLDLHHMRDFHDYVLTRWESLDPPAIAAQPAVDESLSRLIDTFTGALSLKRESLSRINAMWRVSMDENNTDAAHFLKKFSRFHVKSIRELETFVQKLRLAGDDPAALMSFDNKVHSRNDK